MPRSRREFLKAIAAAGMLGASVSETTARQGALPNPKSSGIDHVVVVCMENRSFDHFLGWLPGANGRQAGLSYPSSSGPQSTYHLTTYTGCHSKSPDNSWAGGRIQYDNGLCDGWLLDPNNDSYCIGYYTQTDLAFLAQAAPYWTTCDQYFSAIMGPTFPNRMYLHAGVTDRLTDSILPFSRLPAIWDALAAAGVSGRYYYTDLSFLSLWGFKYASISAPIAKFFVDCDAGTLPSVAYVEPSFLGDVTGTGNDDHPFNDIRNGEYFLNQVYKAVTTGRDWARTVLILTYDEWGGFFDHIEPQNAPDINTAYQLRGFRVPCLVISPLAPRNTVAHGLYDHASVLTFIEWRWNLPPLSVRDQYANNIGEVLDFSRPRDLSAPQYGAGGTYPAFCL